MFFSVWFWGDDVLGGGGLRKGGKANASIRSTAPADGICGKPCMYVCICVCTYLHDAAEGQVADRRERGDVHLRDILVGKEGDLKVRHGPTNPSIHPL